MFNKDAASDSYSRSVFSLLDLTGNLGGLFEILQITGSLIVVYFSRDLLLYSLLSKLYQVYQPNSENIMPLNVLKASDVHVTAPDDKSIDNSSIGLHPTSKAFKSKVTF
jgi:hypothetical protein